MTREISALQEVLRHSVSSYRLLLGTNVAALKYMKREIEAKKEESLVGYDFSAFTTSGSNAGGNIKRIEDKGGKGEGGKGKKDKKKRKAEVINIGNGNAVKQSKN